MAEALIEGLNRWVESDGCKRGHVEDVADIGATAPNAASPSDGATIAVERCNGYESSDLLVGELAKLGEPAMRVDAMTGAIPRAVLSRSDLGCHAGLFLMVWSIS